MSLKKCKEAINRELKDYGKAQQAVLPCLHAAQEKCGYISEEVLSYLAKELGISRVELYSVVSFYSMFKLEKKAKNVLQVCVSLPCYIKGSKSILEVIREKLGIGPGEVSSDGKFSIETVSCLGACDKAPVMMVNDKMHEDVTPEKAKEIISKLKGKRTVKRKSAKPKKTKKRKKL